MINSWLSIAFYCILEIQNWEEKINQNSQKISIYTKYIESQPEQIFLLNEINNITLEEKKSFLEDK